MPASGSSTLAKRKNILKRRDPPPRHEGTGGFPAVISALFLSFVQMREDAKAFGDACLALWWRGESPKRSC